MTVPISTRSAVALMNGRAFDLLDDGALSGTEIELRKAMARVTQLASRLIEEETSYSDVADLLENLAPVMLQTRRARGQNTVEAAEQCGLGQTTYWRTESGAVDEPRLSTIVAILRWLDGGDSA